MLNELKNIVDTADIITKHGKNYFDYLREPYEKGEKILENAYNNNGTITVDDIQAVAMQFVIRKYVKKIKNYDSIISKMERQLDILLEKAGSENELSLSRPDNDWLEYFFDLSSKVSNEAVQEIWAYILLQEHMKNGCVKKIMLNTLALLDAESARCFQNLCRLTYELKVDEDIRVIPFVIYDYNIENLLENYDSDKKPFTQYLEICPNEEQLDYLAELGLITTTNLTESIYMVYSTESTEVSFSCCGETIQIQMPFDAEDNNYQVQTGFVFFTQVGLALYNVLNVSAYEGLFSVVKRFAENQVSDE